MSEDKMKIIITGATGYIGKHLVAALCSQYEIYAIVREKTDISYVKQFLKKAIIYDYNTIYDEIKKINTDLLIHLAGVFYGEHSKENILDLLESNIVFASVVLDSAVHAGVKKIINTGTYWQQYNGEIYNQVNLYAATKQAVEDILLYYIKAENCKAITVQIFDTYGPDDDRKKILNIISNLEDGEQIDMSGGEQKLYYCYIDDIVNGYLRAIFLLNEMDFGEYKKYSLREKKPIYLKEIVREYLEIHSKAVDIKWGGKPYRKREIMDPTEIGTIMPGWNPEYSLQKGLKNIK